MLTALLIVVLILWRFGAAIASRLKAVQEQVANDHKKPDGSPMLLRDDLDEKHVENAGKLDLVLAAVKPIPTMQRDIAFLLRRSIEQDDRIEDLEKTQPPKE